MYVITFYSYKGGVGRTVALLNTAWGLAMDGSEVALLDLDLEAPGLHEAYLLQDRNQKRGWRPLGSIEIKGSFHGLVEDYQNGELVLKSPEDAKEVMRAYVTKGLGPSERMALLPARKGEEDDYAHFLQGFSWPDFYLNKKGKVVTAAIVSGLTQLGYDYLLIDARTGLTDVRGPTFIDMPDLVVMLTNLTKQSVKGTREQLDYLEEVNEEVRQEGSKGRRPGREETPVDFLVVGSPLPMGEYELRDSRVQEVQETLGRPLDVEIDYVPALAIDEQHQIIAQFEQGNMRRVRQPYDDLIEAIVAHNPQAPEKLLAQGDRLMELQRWREALAHYDEVYDQMTAHSLGSSLQLRSWAGKIRAQVGAPSQVYRAIEEINSLPAGHSAGKRQAKLRLAAAWTLVVSEKFKEAAEQAEKASELLDYEKKQGKEQYTGRELRELIELGIIAKFAQGQALSFSNRLNEAREILGEAIELCEKDNALPLIHVLAIAEWIRVAAATGLVAGINQRIEKARSLLGYAGLKSSSVTARLAQAEAEALWMLGKGEACLNLFDEAFGSFWQDTDFVGCLECLAMKAQIEVELTMPEGPESLEGWQGIAQNLSMTEMEERLRLFKLERSLAAGMEQAKVEAKAEKTKAERILQPEFDLYACKVALVDGEEEKAQAKLDQEESDDREHPLVDHHRRLLKALVDVALVKGRDADLSGLDETYVAELEKRGLKLRLLQARFVRAVWFSKIGGDEALDEEIAALREITEELSLKADWLWNFPFAFATHSKALEEIVGDVRKKLDLDWPLPKA